MKTPTIEDLEKGIFTVTASLTQPEMPTSGEFEFIDKDGNNIFD